MRQTIEDAAKDYAIGKTFFARMFSKKWMMTMCFAKIIVVRTSKQVLNGKWQKLLMLTGKVVQTSLKTMT